MLTQQSVWLGLARMSCVGVLWLGLVGVCQAGEYIFPVYARYEAIEVISDPHHPKTYYATLEDFPHTYEFTLVTTTPITIGIASFDTETIPANKNIMLVKKNSDGSVSEVARVNAGDAQWSVVTDRFIAETYRQGQTFSGDLDAGAYLLEVNSPSNEGHYALQLGAEKSGFLFNPFTEMIRVYKLKHWLDRSSLSIMATPVYFVPFMALVLGLVWYRVRFAAWIRRLGNKNWHD